MHASRPKWRTLAVHFSQYLPSLLLITMSTAEGLGTGDVSFYHMSFPRLQGDVLSFAERPPGSARPVASELSKRDGGAYP